MHQATQSDSIAKNKCCGANSHKTVHRTERTRAARERELAAAGSVKQLAVRKEQHLNLHTACVTRGGAELLEPWIAASFAQN